MKPKCLLVMTNFIGMDDIILENISKRYDAESIIYSFDNQKFKYKNLLQRFTNLYQKLLGNSDYKKQLKNTVENERIQNEIKRKSGVYDLVLVFSIEYFNEKTLRSLKSVSKKMIGYQWDGLGRTPEIFGKINYFHKFYTFDPQDIDNKTIFFATNFYLDVPEVDIRANDTPIESDLLYIGTSTEDRLEKIKALIFEMRKHNKIFKVILLSYEDVDSIRKQYPYEEITIITKSMSYKETLKEVLKTRAILDLKLSVHDGLSFRFFESMKYKKKILTDNVTVKKYDFYNPENIFVLENKNYEGLIGFLKNDYIEIDFNIYKKYGFSNWINYIFG